MNHFLFQGGGGGGGGGGRPFSDPSQPWRFPNLPNNGRRRSLDSICGELRKQFAPGDNNFANAQNIDNFGNTNSNPSQLSNLLENMKNFPLQLPKSPGSNNFGNLANLNSNPLQTPNFAASKSAENFENMDSNPLSPNFAGSNNFNGDNALFGGGNNLDEVKNDLRNSMSNGFESTDVAGNNKLNSNENGFNSNGAGISKGNSFNQYMDNIDQKDGPINDPLLSNFDGDKKSQFDQSRLYESDDDMWNFGQYDSMTNYDFPASYYNSGDQSYSWMMGDVNGYRRLVLDTLW